MDPYQPVQEPQVETPIVQPTPEIPPKSSKLKFILIALALIILITVGTGGYYLGSNKKENASKPSPTTTLSVAPTNSASPTSTISAIPTQTVADETANINKGIINGKICYPSSGIPEGYILAKNLRTNNVEKVYKQGDPPPSPTFSLSLEEGRYVFAYQPIQTPDYMGFYTSCAIALDNCSTLESHKLIEVTIEANKTINNINICDFYYQPEQKPAF